MLFCGCFSSKGPENIVRHHELHEIPGNFQITGNLKSESAPARKLKLGHRWILQQDNDPKHPNQHKRG